MKLSSLIQFLKYRTAFSTLLEVHRVARHIDSVQGVDASDPLATR